MCDCDKFISQEKRETEKGTLVGGSNWSFLLSVYAKRKRIFIENVDQWFLNLQKNENENIRLAL